MGTVVDSGGSFYCGFVDDTTMGSVGERRLYDTTLAEGLQLERVRGASKLQVWRKLAEVKLIVV